MDFKLTEKEIKTLVTALNKIAIEMAQLACVLEGALEGYYGGKEDDDRK